MRQRAITASKARCGSFRFSEDSWHPAFHPLLVIDISLTEAFAQALFVAQHTEMEPDRACRREQRRRERLQRKGEADEKKDVPEVHRVSRVRVRARGHQMFRRRVHPRPAAAARQAVVADQPILQVAPGEQRCEPWLYAQLAIVQQQFPAHDEDRVEEKGAKGGAAQLPRNRHAQGLIPPGCCCPSPPCPSAPCCRRSTSASPRGPARRPP